MFKRPVAWYGRKQREIERLTSLVTHLEQDLTQEERRVGEKAFELRRFREKYVDAVEELNQAKTDLAQERTWRQQSGQRVTELKEDLAGLELTIQGMRSARGCLINDLLSTQERVNVLEEGLEELMGAYRGAHALLFGQDDPNYTIDMSYAYVNARRLLRGSQTNGDVTRNSGRNGSDGATHPASPGRSNLNPPDGGDEVQDSPGVLRSCGDLHRQHADVGRP